MAAAQKLFLARGVDATTISEIVEEAQVAKGTFYHYFSTKNDMLAMLRRRYTQQFLEQLEKAVDACPADDAIGRLRAWIQANVKTYLKTYRVHDMVYGGHHHHERNNREKNAILDQLMGILEGGRQSGAWPLEQPRLTASLIYAGVHGVTDDAIATRPADSDAFSRNVSDACLRMLGVTEKASSPAPRKRQAGMAPG